MKRTALLAALIVFLAVMTAMFLSPAEAAVATDGTVTQVSSGELHTCALQTDGSIACWGDNSEGQAEPPDNTFSQVSAGSLHTCGIRADQTVVCWGNNDFGQLTVPDLFATFSQISAGANHTCGILQSTSSVVCWGDNSAAQVSEAPADAFTQVAAGALHTCGILQSTSTIVCWGNNDLGQLAVPDPFATFSQISAGGLHTCGILQSNSSIVCWGDNSQGQSTPIGGPFTDISSGGLHTCGIQTGGSATCWGDNSSGQSTATGGTFLDISSGWDHTCGVLTDNTAVCWGDNSSGQSMPVHAATPAYMYVPASSSNGSIALGWGLSNTSNANYIVEESTDAGFAGAAVVYNGSDRAATLEGRTNGNTYYYRVRATKTGLLHSAWADGPNGCAVAIVAGTPAYINVPASSSNGNIVLTWGASSTSDSTYVVQESITGDFTDAVQVYSGIDRNTTLTGKTNGTTYFYRVMATKAGHTDSGWRTGSNGCAVGITAGTPASIFVPANPNAAGQVPLSWGISATPGVTYVVQESTASDFSANLTQVYSGLLRTFTVTGKTNGTYYYRVKAVKDGSTDSSWRVGSNPCVVAITVGTPVYFWFPDKYNPASYTGWPIPAIDITTGVIQIGWGISATTGVTYVVQESTDVDFASFTQIYSGPGRESATLPGRASGTYYYRVKATKTGFTDSAWVYGPIYSPAPGGWYIPVVFTNGNLTISWGITPTVGANYVVQESTAPDFSANLTQVYSGPNRTVSLSGKSNGTTYYYRVKAILAGRADSYWVNGPYGSTAVAAAEAPASITVPASSSNGTIALTWGASGTAGVTYVLQESTAADFSGAAQVYSGSSLSATLNGRSNGTYYYRVKATKTGLSDSTWANGANSCVVTLAAGTPAYINVPAPTSGGVINLAWGSSSTPSPTYVVEESKDSGLWNEVYRGPDRTTSLTRTNGTYDYRVKAIKAGLADSAWVSGSTTVALTASAPASMYVPAPTSGGIINLAWGISSSPSPTYVVEESTASDFSANLIQIYSGTDRTFSVTRTNGTYWYRVKAQSAGYTDSAWVEGGSSTVAITVGRPASMYVPATPNPSMIIGLVVGISSTPGVTYVVEESKDDPTFAAAVQIYSNTSRNVNLTGRTTGTYYYRAKAIKDGYTDSAWRDGTVGCVVP